MNKIYKFFTLIIMTIALVIAAEETANAQIGWQKSAGQSLIDALKVKEPLTFCNEKVPLKENDVRERLEREMLVSCRTAMMSSCGSNALIDIFRTLKWF